MDYTTSEKSYKWTFLEFEIISNEVELESKYLKSW